MNNGKKRRGKLVKKPAFVLFLAEQAYHRWRPLSGAFNRGCAPKRPSLLFRTIVGVQPVDQISMRWRKK